MLERDGWVYVSQPVRVVDEAGAVRIDRERSTVSPAGDRTAADDSVRLARLDAATLEAEGAQVGLRPAGRRRIDATEEHVGSRVVVLRA
jgi:hypothetical protein